MVSLGAAADAQATAVVADVQPSAATLPSLTGQWLTRTRVATNEAGTVLGCEFYQSRPCPTPDFFLVIACDTRIYQTGTQLTFDSTCSTVATVIVFCSIFTFCGSRECFLINS